MMDGFVSNLHSVSKTQVTKVNTEEAEEGLERLVYFIAVHDRGDCLGFWSRD